MNRVSWSRVVLACVCCLVALSAGEHPGLSATPPWITLVTGSVLTGLLALRLLVLPLPLPRWSVFIVGLLVWSLCCHGEALSPFLSRQALANWAVFGGLLLALQSVQRNESNGRLLAWWMLALAAVLCALGAGPLRSADSHLKATFTNPDCFSLLPFSASLLALGLAASPSHSGRGRVGWPLLAVVLLLAGLYTGSRAGLVGWVVGFLSFLVFRLRAAGARRVALPLLLLGLAALGVLLVAGGSIPVVQRAQMFLTGRDPDASLSRFNVLVYGLRSWWRSPLLGAGPGCFALAYQQDRPPGGLDAFMNVAHNDFMQWLVETGWPGLLLWIGVAAVPLAEGSGGARGGLWAGACSAALCALTYSTLNVAAPVLADLLWLGALLGVVHLTRPRAAELGKRVSVLAGLVLLVCVAGALPFSYRTARVAQLKRLADDAQKQLDWEGAFGQLEQASALQPGNADLRLQMGQLAQHAYLFSGDAKWLTAEEDQLMQASQKNPSDVRVLMQLAAFYGAQQRHQDAREVLDRANRLASYSHDLQRARAWNQVLLGEFDQALKTLSRPDLIDSGGLAELVALNEMQKPGSADLLLRQVPAQQRKVTVQLLARASRVAAQTGKFEVSLRLLRSALKLQKNNSELQLQLAEVLNSSGQSAAAVEILEKLRSRSLKEEIPDELDRRVWQRWTEARLKLGPRSAVARGLEDFLAKEPRETWARVLLSQLLEEAGRRGDARAALRDGLNYDVDGSLRVALGDLYHKHRLDEVARSYYEEALPLTEDRKAVELKLSQLKTDSQGQNDI